MTQPLILGTRGSDLALCQARMTKAALLDQGVDCEIRVIKTIGDKRPDLKLSEFALGENAIVDKGIFTKELEEALLAQEIDFAVHSLKDVPTVLAEPFMICSTLPRAPIADVILSRDPEVLSWSGLAGKRVATSSVRRAQQLRHQQALVETEDIRGNLPTRIRKLFGEGAPDATMLASAGLQRLEFFQAGERSFEFEGETVHVWELPEGEFLPAAGQGAVAMEILKANTRTASALALINDGPTTQRVTAEREFLHLLEAGCQTPVGVWTTLSEDTETLTMKVRVFDEERPEIPPREASASGAASDPEALAREIFQSIS